MAGPKLDYSHYFWQGEKTRLRPFRVADAELRFKASLDSPTRQAHNGGIEFPSSLELQKRWLERVIDCKNNNGFVLFAMDNLSDETVGWVSLHSLDQKNGTFSFGVAVYRDHRGYGYAVDAVRLLLKYGFWEQRYQKCNSICSHSNEASIRMHIKLGFIEEGRSRRAAFFNGKYHDDVLFGMTREEFDDIMTS